MSSSCFYSEIRGCWLWGGEGGVAVGGSCASLHARLELLPLDATAAGGGEIIEAHIPAQLFNELGLQTNETLVLTPRKARVFVA